MHELPGQSPESKGVWKGADIKVGADVVIKDSAIVSIVIDQGALPEDDNFFISSIRGLKASTKSRLAQLGLEVDESVGRQVSELASKRGYKIGSGTIITAQALVHNFSARPISLEKGTDLFRFFDTPKKSLEGEDLLVEGEDLLDLFLNREIQISGHRRKDWDWTHGNGYIKSNGDINGVAVRIKSGNRLWIPPSDIPISAREIQEAEDYRSMLGLYFVPVPITEQSIFWIGETVDMSLGKGIEAELGKAVAPNLAAIGSLDKWGEQINARLIDGGKTKWPVRVEVLSSTAADRIPNYVTFRFMRGNNFVKAA
jgi:hypothetical protein